MNAPRFDAFSRLIAARLTRRTGLGLLAGASLPLLGITVNTQSKKKNVTLCVDGQTVKKPKKQAKKLQKQGAIKGPCVVTAEPPRCGNGGPCTVFVTSHSFTGGEIRSLASGDDRCQEAAEAANLAGTFKVWLSFDSDTPGSRFSNVAKAGPYRLVPNGGDIGGLPPLVATDFADLLSCPGPGFICLQSAINRDENGQSVPAGPEFLVWTGTLNNGVSSAQTCSGWSSSSGEEQGKTGRSDQLDIGWTEYGPSSCDQRHSIYCFQQAT